MDSSEPIEVWQAVWMAVGLDDMDEHYKQCAELTKKINEGVCQALLAARPGLELSFYINSENDMRAVLFVVVGFRKVGWCVDYWPNFGEDNSTRIVVSIPAHTSI